MLDKTPFKEYAPQSPNVVTGLQLERILSATGPTEGELQRPSDGKKPRTVAFISCVGSRSKYHHPYCSNICCMYMLKQARLIREKYRDVNVYIFFTDVRTGGKDFEEYYTYCRQLGVKIIRGYVGCLEELSRDRLWVRAYDIDIGAPVELESDLVVLATAVEPAAGLDQLSRKLGITCGNEGFLKELHTKLYPVETPIRGIYIAGCVQGPKDITDSVAQARAASAAATIPLAAGKVAVEPLTAEVNPVRCSGCGICVPLCPYSAITMAKGGEKLRATVEEMLCVGCGVCTAACPPRAIRLHGFTSTQIEAQIEAITLGIGGGAGA
jgi:heterodisulfide reductase subunit A